MFFKIFSSFLLKVGLKFAKIFEVGDHNACHNDNWIAAENLQDDGGSESSLSSPNSSSKEKERKKEMDEPTESSSSTSNCRQKRPSQVSAAAPPSARIGRLSIRSFNKSNPQSNRNPTSASDLIFPTSFSAQPKGPKPLPHSYQRPFEEQLKLTSNPATTMPAGSVSQSHHRAPPEYKYDSQMKKTFPVRFLKNDKKFIYFVDAVGLRVCN